MSDADETAESALKNAGLLMWQAYCDVKAENEELREQLEVLRAQAASQEDGERIKIVAAWNALPEAFRCHPGLKHLYQLLGGASREPLSAHTTTAMGRVHPSHEHPSLEQAPRWCGECGECVTTFCRAKSPVDQARCQATTTGAKP